MVQGLGFLSKKSWHTKNLNNQEKVWIAEQQQEQERLRTTELAKQIQLEREQDELHDIVAGDGSGQGNGSGSGSGTTTQKKKRSTYDRGIDWMYTGHSKDSAMAKEDADKQAEEYLLGKPITGTSTVLTNVNTIGTGFGIGTYGTADTDATAAANATNTNSIESTGSIAINHNELHDEYVPTFHKSHKYEDPMYAVSLRAVRNEKRIEQQQELYQKVGMTTTTATATTTHDQIITSKQNQRNKKSKDNSYDRRERDDRYDDKRQKKKHSKRHHRSTEEEEDKQSMTKKRLKGVGDGYGNKSYTNTTKNDDDDDDDDDDESSSDSYNRKRDRKKHHRRCDDDHHDDHHDDVDNSRTAQIKSKQSGYGLQQHLQQSQHTSQQQQQHRNTDLGPDRELLQRKREEQTSRNPHRHGTGGHRHGKSERDDRRGRRIPPTKEERERAIRAMEENAKSYNNAIQQNRNTQASTNSHDHSEENHRVTNAPFLQEMSQKVHGVYDNHRQR
jgi:N-terminal domain of CBF1 interacting co-repressor CIR